MSQVLITRVRHCWLARSSEKRHRNLVESYISCWVL